MHTSSLRLLPLPPPSLPPMLSSPGSGWYSAASPVAGSLCVDRLVALHRWELYHHCLRIKNRRYVIRFVHLLHIIFIFVLFGIVYFFVEEKSCGSCALVCVFKICHARFVLEILLFLICNAFAIQLFYLRNCQFEDCSVTLQRKVEPCVFYAASFWILHFISRLLFANFTQVLLFCNIHTHR